MRESKDKKAPAGGPKNQANASEVQPGYWVSLTNTIMGLNPLALAKNTVQDGVGSKQVTDKKNENGYKQQTVTAVRKTHAQADSEGIKALYIYKAGTSTVCKGHSSIPPTDNGWTDGQDGLIIIMRGDKRSWAEIEDIIKGGRGLNEIKKRYDELKKLYDELKARSEYADTDESESEGYGDDEEDDEDEDSEEEDEESDDEEEYDFSPASFSYSSSSSSDDEDGYDADDYDPYGPMDPVAWERERRRHQRFAQRHLWASLYRKTGDDSWTGMGFSKRDRSILFSLHDRALANRYLEMQANFLNATGRMVPLHLIQARLQGRTPTEEEHMLPRIARFQARVAKWNQSVADGDELLDPSTASDIPADALRADEGDE
ncbi:hypothetical protein SODALDRAFT_347949 [Sodiomyces alkalinus F11]|uniref:Myb-like domain-containing protein n=1 Tax=Sodiomyces alkalinus (strain CBS 110278 / VKM F-3762 / F11) TaxID=1314773 RepID=A0A3N2Q8Q2_SODAK|nr:hypothetical protein SODALDRAFT_347949 [Sodiomyces alkalinus F11]ROT43153.1 hypothetical protein SODALDRAFT_347949 [Sodiomyces alkalinus F11]